MKKQAILNIGILRRKEVHFSLSKRVNSAHLQLKQGKHALRVSHGKVELDGKPLKSGTLEFGAQTEGLLTTLHGVTIGIGFHWEQNEDQVFEGCFVFRADGDMLQVINQVQVEDYIKSVVSSEMSANAPLEFIKAHAVISRSWALAQLKQAADNGKKWMINGQKEQVVWYDKDSHVGFDLCADDHCQRYQGLSRLFNNNAPDAVLATRGEVMISDGEICDTRFSKCCGGVSEDFENVWQPSPHKYLQAVVDNVQGEMPDLQTEESFVKWLDSEPTSFCNTKDHSVLSAVLNDYDQKTDDFFRWTITYKEPELRALLKLKTGIDFGEIHEFVPLERGRSGRLIRMEIVGEKVRKVFGKELEIRRILAEKHLYSAAFVVAKNDHGKSTVFEFRGSGWGHGVGLCQIGAAAMSFKGYGYKQILEHYFNGASIAKWYE